MEMALSTAFLRVLRKDNLASCTVRAIIKTQAHVLARASFVM